MCVTPEESMIEGNGALPMHRGQPAGGDDQV